MDFEWDEGKRLANIEKHGVDFRLAAGVFFGPTIEADDTREDYGEVRRRPSAVSEQNISSWSTPREAKRSDSSAHGRLDDMTAKNINTYSASDITRMIASGSHVATKARAKEAGPRLDRSFWKNARVVLPGDSPKVPISLRLDAEVLAWFKSSGKGYLSRINAVLRAYVEAQRPPQS